MIERFISAVILIIIACMMVEAIKMGANPYPESFFFWGFMYAFLCRMIIESVQKRIE